jgi:parvulin-like peptidyl-prolyl isomerase
MKFKTNKGLLITICMVASMMLSLNAQETINGAKLQSFTAQKHRVDFNAQTESSKNDIVNDYVKTIKLSDKILEGTLKNDPDFEIANRLLAINIWAQKVIKDTKISDRKLRNLYKKHAPMIEARYELRNILLKSETEANKIEKTLKKITNKNKRLEKFKQLVESSSEDFITRKNDGQFEWIDENKLTPTMRDALKGKKSNEIIKVYVENIGWQVLLLEDFQASKKATLEESKAVLTNLAKQEILSKKIKEMLK